MVVGGGISGLVAAHDLQAAGVSVAIVEKSDRLGGVVLTEEADGFLVEGGPDSFVVAKQAVVSMAEQLGLSESLISTRPEHRGAYVWWGDRLHALPDGLLLMAPSRMRPLFGSTLLSWRGKARVLADLVLPRGPSQDDESLESFVVRRLGREILDRIAEPLIAGIHAAEPANMSLRASFPRFLEMEQRHRSLILAARAAASRKVSEGGLSYFASFRSGMGQLTDALVESLDRTRIITGVEVRRIDAVADGSHTLTLGDGTRLTAPGVVLATPAPATARLIGDLHPQASAAISEIRQLATATVTLGYQTDGLPPLSGTGFVVPSAAGRRIMGVSYMSHKWEGRVPGPEFTLLRVFVGGPSGQEFARSEKIRLIDLARDELRSMLGIRVQPIVARVHSWGESLHQYTLGHIERVALAEASIGTRPGLALAGSGFHGIGLNECINSGRAAAAKVIGFLDGDGTLLSERANSERGDVD